MDTVPPWLITDFLGTPAWVWLVFAFDLKYALALVLVFIGTKIFLVGFIGKFPPVVSLAVTFGLIAGGVVVSMWKTRQQGELPAAG